MFRWLQKNQLYFLLIGCILAVGFGTFILCGITPSSQNPNASDTPTPPPDTISDSTVNVTAPPAEEVVEPVAVSMPEITESPVDITVSDPVNYQLPLSGKVIRDYAIDHLIYSATMGDWRTHAGIDFAAAVGTPVCAVADGTISEVFYDTLLGITVKIAHDDDKTSVYANLASLDTIHAGESVKQGAVIGTVGETALLEADEPAHLHFELYENSNVINPSAVLPLLP